MKRNHFLGALAALLVFASVVALGALGQDRQPPADAKRLIPMRVQVVFEEYDGQKKIASLPYTFRVVANDNPASIRDGLRVPISMAGPASGQGSQFQYMDVGANIDCGAMTSDEGAFKLRLSVQRTFLFTPDELNPAMDLNKASVGAGGNPVIQTFNSSFNLLMRDNQTIEAATVTNPLNGRVLKVLVTINVEK